MNDEAGSNAIADTVAETVEKTVEAAEEIVRLPLVHRIARFGFYAKALLFVVIGGLAMLLAMGSREGTIADPAGALAIISQQYLGHLLLFAFGVGAAGHGFWNILRAAADVDDAGRGALGILKRVIAGGVGVFYLGLSATALQIVLAAAPPAGESQAEEMLVTVLLSIPILGVVMLVIIGLGVVGAGVHECYSGLSGRFRNAYRVWEISGPHLAFITFLGIVSFTARAVLLIVLGYFFLSAAFDDIPGGSIGLDAALAALASSRFGTLALFGMAFGLMAHGVLALYEARFRRLC
jgi:hypothetical protein